MKLIDKFLVAFVILAGASILFFGEQWLHPHEFAQTQQQVTQGVFSFFQIVGIIVLVLLTLAVVLGVWYLTVRINNERGVVRSSEKSQAVAIRKKKTDEHEVIPLAMASVLNADPNHQLAQFKQIAQIYSMMMREARKYDLDEEYEYVDETVDALPPQNDQRLLAPPQPERSIYLSREYIVPADDFLSGRKLIVGTSGSGKSNSVGVYGEELGRLEVPFVLGDTEDEYRLLCNPQWLRNGICAGASGMYAVTVEDAEQFGRYVLDNLLQVILNLQSYEMVEAAQVMIGIITGMRQWQEERENERRIPSDFILEEAVTWLPQQVSESPIKGQDPQTMAALQNTFFNDMVRKGRKRGLGIALVCQKIAELDNRAMQSDGKLLHRQTEEADLERYRKMGITREETLSLQNGEAFLFTGRASKTRIQVRRRYSPHGANTPGLDQLRQHQIARNSSGKTQEIWGNFGENPEKQASGSEFFSQPTEPSRNISEFRKPEISPQKNGGDDIPEMLRKEILERYSEGMKRTEIRDDLQLNGDQYWMIRVVCDQYDLDKKAVL